MAFTFHITIPAGTPEESPVKEILTLEEGIVYKVQIVSSPATNGEVFCRLEDIYGRQILPLKEGSYFRLWGQVIEARYPSIQIETRGDKAKVVFVGWSPNARYSHTVDVTFLIVPEVYENLLKRVEA